MASVHALQFVVVAATSRWRAARSRICMRRVGAVSVDRPAAVSQGATTMTIVRTVAFSCTITMSATTVQAGDVPSLDVELIVEDLVAPLDLTSAPDDSDRRFIVDQTGLVLILTEDDQLLPEPFLDITDRVVVQSAFDERGLLGLAFHPEFEDNGKLYVHYSAEREGENICVDADGNVPDDPDGCPFQHTRRISEFTVSKENPNHVDPDSEEVIFSIQWPGRKHNGGGLAFGPEGLLYIGLGDGGWIHGPDGGGSPFDVDPDLLFGDLIAQDLSQLYGKILRIDVDNGDPYAIPEDNPFAGDDGIPDEIFAWGFRNPFRISFDPENDEDHDDLAMFVSATADTLFEATYMVTGPGNFGWARKEGTHCIVRTSAYAPPELFECKVDDDCPSGPQVTFCGKDGRCTCSDLGPLGEPIRDPVIEYLNFAVEDPESQFEGEGFGRASLGGHMYRGDAIPELEGLFVQGDFAIDQFNGQIIVAVPNDVGLWDLERAFTFNPDDPDEAGFMKAVGRDGEGELYAVTGNFSPKGLRGKIWKIVAGCREDLDEDGTVGVEDLLALLEAWNTEGPGDLNGDGTVDVYDLLELLAAWGPCA
jgi:glucose/arabinose dehydrogenase